MNLVKDPLLGAANAVLVLFIAVLGLAAAVFVAAAPLVLIFKGEIVPELVKEGAEKAALLFPGVSLMLLALALLLAMGVYFLVLLRRIVRSVGNGDPFVPVNAVRLSRMGWTTLIAQFVAIPIGFAVVRLATLVADADDRVDVGDDFGISGTGLLLALVLFILARVFRTGTAMREELEGTV